MNEDGAPNAVVDESNLIWKRPSGVGLANARVMVTGNMWNEASDK